MMSGMLDVDFSRSCGWKENATSTKAVCLQQVCRLVMVGELELFDDKRGRKTPEVASR
jgi:hypothetical protein